MTEQTVTLPPDSRGKVETYLRFVAEQAGGDALGAAAVAMLPMFLGRLPDDSEVLDQLLAQYAATLLALRSDDAEALHIAAGPYPDVEPGAV